jgi:hypothetical protein
MATIISSAPIFDRRGDSVPAVSSSSIRTLRQSNIGPVSMPASRRMMVTPVSRSPRISAHWIGAAPRVFRQQRGVHVEAAEARHVEHRLRQDLAVGDDDGDIRLQSRELGDELRIARPRRLQHRHRALDRELLHRRRVQLAAAAGRLVGLADHRHHLLGVEEGPQRRHRELRRAHEDDAHQASPTGSASR